MSGVYNNWIKVQNPEMNNNNIQMESGGFQKPFYFGGSQIPSYFKEKEDNNYEKTNFNPEIKGKGIQTTQIFKQSNIHIPRHLGTFNKDI